MKITQTQLKQLIRESAVKYKRVLELEEKKAEIVKQLNEMEEGFLGMQSDEEKNRQSALIRQFDGLVGQGAVGDKNAFIEKAKEDNFGGTLIVQPARGAQFAGKKMIIYLPKPTMMQKLAAGTSSQTTGGGTGAKQTAFEGVEEEGFLRDNPLSKALGVKSTEQFDQDTLNDRILPHPSRNKFYQSIRKNPKMASEYIKFWGTHDRPTDIPVWDEKTQTFIDRGLGAGAVGG